MARRAAASLDLAAACPAGVSSTTVFGVMVGMKYAISLGWNGSRTSSARTPALKWAKNTMRLWNTGAVDSFDEWVPNRPPREQKSPLDSGTVHVATPNGFVSVVTSTNQTIWRASAHAFWIDSSVITTKSRRDPAASCRNSP